MKRIKGFWWIILLIFLLIGGLTAYGLWRWKNHSQAGHVSWTKAVPPGAIFVLHTRRPQTLWKEVHRHPLFRSISRLPDYRFLQSVDSLLNNYVVQNDLTSDFFRRRDFALSAHIVAGNDYDFLYVLDMEKILPAKQILAMLRQWGPEAMHIKTMEINHRPLWKITGLTDDPLYLSFYRNLALMSFSYQILRQSLLDIDGKDWLQDKTFQSINDEIDGGLAHFYFDYRQLPAFLATFGMKPGAMTYGLARAFRLSGLGLERKKDLVIADGITLPDTAANLLEPFRQTRGAGTEAPDILPERTLLYTSLHTADFAAFYRSALQEQFRRHPQQEKLYRKYTGRLKQWLGFDVDKDFIAWIGDEIGLAQLPAEGGKKSVALLIRADDIDFAREKMDFLARKLRRRTPVKFRSYDYEGYRIHYLSEKSFFRMLFGKWTGGASLPYYTIARDFVIFSDNEKTLEQILNALIARRTLSHVPAFGRVEKNADDKMHLQVWVNVPGFYTEMYKSLIGARRKALSEWYAVAHALRFVSMQWTVDDDNIRTKIIFQAQEKKSIK